MSFFPPEIVNDSTQSLFVKRSVRSKAIYLVVVVTVAVAIALLPFIYVSVTTQARGIIRTPNENNPIQSAVYGEVTDIRMVENAEVKKGDTLLVLNAEAIDVQIRNKISRLDEDSIFIADITALLDRKYGQLTTSKYRTEHNYFRTSMGELQTKVNYLRNELAVTKKLYEKEISSRSEYLQYKNNYETAAGQLANLGEQFRNRWSAERTNYEIEIRELQSSIRQLEDEKTKYVLCAPASGAIIQFSGIQQGSFIIPGQTLASISTDSALLVECYISPTDIGYVRKNQPVAFQLDAFNYNQWGLAHGVVREISKDIITMNEQPVFRVRCSLDTPFLQLKNGYQGNLKKGMTLTGRFYLTDRSLWQLLFDKIDNWMNPKNNNF